MSEFDELRSMIEHAIYFDEVQLLDFGESRTAGRYIKIRLSDSEGDPLEPFRGMDTATAKRSGHVLRVLISTAHQGEQKPAAPASTNTHPYSEYARMLKLNGFFSAPDVWKAAGAEAKYFDWLRDQRCAACGWQPHQVMNDKLKCEAAHVRRINRGAGTGLKPPYWAVPLCPPRLEGGRQVPGCHKKQHQGGESEVLTKEQFDARALKFIEQWAWDTVKHSLGFESMADVPPDVITKWAIDHRVERYLPAAFRGFIEHAKKQKGGER